MCWVGCRSTASNRGIPGALNVTDIAEGAGVAGVSGLPHDEPDPAAYYTTPGGGGAALAWCHGEVRKSAGMTYLKFIQPATL